MILRDRRAEYFLRLLLPFPELKGAPPSPNVSRKRVLSAMLTVCRSLRDGTQSISNRGLDAQTLAVLTGIHNFDIRGADGTTPAQRLFGHYASKSI